MKLTKGTRIRWTASDEMGKFQHTGTVVKTTKSVVWMASEEVGEMAFERNDGQIEVIRHSRKSKVTAEKARADRALKQPKAKRVLKAGTVKAQVFELLKGKTVTRKEAIAMIVEAGLSSPAGASTHFNSVKDLI